jgi:hypothetical protein
MIVASADGTVHVPIEESKPSGRIDPITINGRRPASGRRSSGRRDVAVLCVLCVVVDSVVQSVLSWTVSSYPPSARIIHRSSVDCLGAGIRIVLTAGHGSDDPVAEDNAIASGFRLYHHHSVRESLEHASFFLCVCRES